MQVISFADIKDNFESIFDLVYRDNKEVIEL